MLLTKQNVKGIKCKNTVLRIDEYDMEINLRAMSLSEQLEVEEKSKQNKNLFISQILKNCCVDDQGQQLFDTIEDVESLPADLTLLIFKECLKLNGLGDKDVEKLAKNS